MNRFEHLNQPVLIGTIILLMVTGLASTDIYLPSLPAITAAFSTTTTMTKLSVTLFMLGYATSQLIGGIISDKVGRKAIVVPGLIGYIVGCIMIIFAINIEMVLVGRLIQGISIGAVACLSRVILRDCFSGSHLLSRMAIMAIFVALGPSLAPALGGFLQAYFGFRANFLWLLMMGLIALLLVTFKLPETIENKNIHATKLSTIKQNIKTLYTSTDFICNAICSGIALSVILSYSTINSFLLQNQLEISPGHYGALTLLTSTGLVTGMILNKFLSPKLGIKKMVVLGQCVIFIAGTWLLIPALLHIFTIPALIIPCFVATIGVAFTFPNAATGSFLPFPHMAGMVGALYGTTQILFSFLISSLVAYIHSTNQLPLSILIISLAALGITMSGYHYIKSEKKDSQNLNQNGLNLAH